MRLMGLMTAAMAMAFACGQGGVLPQLPAPSGEELVPSRLQARVSDPDLAFDNDWQVASQTQWIELEVLVWGASSAQAETELAGETVSFTFANARQARTRALGLDQGSSCVTASNGRCRLAVRVGTEPGDWVVRATALSNSEVFADQHLVVGLGDARRVVIQAPGLPSRDWHGALPHPWMRDELILAQSQPAGGPLTVTVFDQYNNPVSGSRITLRVEGLSLGSGADAGPRPDASNARTDASADGGLDAGPSDDVGTGDSGLLDAGPRADAAPADAGERVATGCPLAACLGPESALRVEGVTDDQGRVVTQLVPGASAGRFTLALIIAESGDSGFEFPRITLNGKTYQRMAADLIFEGQATCFPADTVHGATVRVIDANGDGVPNVSLQLIAEGLFGASAPPTDGQGWTQISARCPSQPPGPNEVLQLRAIVADQPEIQVDIPVGFETAAPDQIAYLPVRLGANSIVAGSVALLRFRVTDPNGFPVPEAQITAQPVSDADLGRLTFREGDTFRTRQTLATNAAGEVIFEVRPIGARTQPDYPLQLQVVSEVNPSARTTLPVHVLGGSPQRVQVVRGQNMHLLTGQAGATVTVRVDDGQDNPISHVHVSLGESPDLIVAPTQGYTNSFGEFHLGILNVLGLDDGRTLRLPFEASWQDSEGVPWTGSTELVVHIGLGQATSVALSQGGQRLGLCEGDPCLYLDAGALLSDPVQLQVVNANGGALRNQPLEVNLIDDQPQGCGSRPNQGENLGTTGESAAVFLGGDVGAQWRAGDRARTCLWEVRSGVVSQRFLLVQTPALPNAGTFQLVDEQDQLAGEASALLELPPRPLHYFRPLVFDASNSHHIELSVSDRFGNAVAGELLGSNPDNCIVDRGQFVLNEAGKTRLRVAGSVDPRVPCRFSVFSLRDWQGEPPVATFHVGGGVIDVRDFVFEPVADQSRVVRFPTFGDWQGVEVGYLRGGFEQGVILPVDASDERGFCAERERCTVVELLYLGTYDWSLPTPRVLCGETVGCPSLLIKRTRTSYIVELPRAQLRTPGRFALRLFTPGQPAITSELLPFWTRPVPGGVTRQASIVAPPNHSDQTTVDLITQALDDGRKRIDACGYSFYNDPNDPEARFHQYRAWVASWTSEVPQAARRTTLPQSINALAVGTKGYPGRGLQDASLCQADDLNGDGVHDLVLLGTPLGDQHGQNCVHAVFGDPNGGFIRLVEDIGDYCGTMPGCQVRQMGEGQTALAVLDFCDPNLPNSQRAYTLDMQGDPLDPARYIEVGYARSSLARIQGGRPQQAVMAIRRFGYLSRGGRLVVLGDQGRAGLMHAYPDWLLRDVDGLAWDDVVEYKAHDCGDGDHTTFCSSVVQGGAELLMSGFDGLRMVANNHFVEAKNQGGLMTVRVDTGQPRAGITGFESRALGLSPSMAWWFKPVGNRQHRLEHWHGSVQEYPWPNCNAEDVSGCPQQAPIQTYWLNESVYLLFRSSGFLGVPPVVELRHVDHPSAPYSNPISVQAVTRYSLYPSSDGSRFLVSDAGWRGLGLVSVDLNADLNQRLSYALLPEPVRSWGNSCALSPNNNYLACSVADPPTILLYTIQDQSHRSIVLSPKTLGADAGLDNINFLNNGLIIAHLVQGGDRKTVLVDPVTSEVVREFYGSTTSRSPGRNAWRKPGDRFQNVAATAGDLPGGGAWVVEPSSWPRKHVRIDLSGQQADELTRTTLPGVHTGSADFDGDGNHSLVLKQLDQVIVWTPQRAQPLCGNGLIDPGERCDDGNLRHDDNCPIDCRSVCGDGERSELEACDDGNQVDGDGCSAQCELP